MSELDDIQTLLKNSQTELKKGVTGNFKSTSAAERVKEMEAASRMAKRTSEITSFVNSELDAIEKDIREDTNKLSTAYQSFKEKIITSKEALLKEAETKAPGSKADFENITNLTREIESGSGTAGKVKQLSELWGKYSNNIEVQDFLVKARAFQHLEDQLSDTKPNNFKSDDKLISVIEGLNKVLKLDPSTTLDQTGAKNDSLGQLVKACKTSAESHINTLAGILGYMQTLEQSAKKEDKVIAPADEKDPALAATPASTAPEGTLPPTGGGIEATTTPANDAKKVGSTDSSKKDKTPKELPDSFFKLSGVIPFTVKIPGKQTLQENDNFTMWYGAGLPKNACKILSAKVVTIDTSSNPRKIQTYILNYLDVKIGESIKIKDLTANGKGSKLMSLSNLNELARDVSPNGYLNTCRTDPKLKMGLQLTYLDGKTGRKVGIVLMPSAQSMSYADFKRKEYEESGAPKLASLADLKREDYK